MICGQLPGFVQDRFRPAGSEIDKAMFGLQAGVDDPGPVVVELCEFHLSFVFAHIPEVRVASLETSFGPREPNAVMMDVIGGIVVGDLFSGRTKNRMNVTAPFELRLYVRAGQFRFGALINENLFPTGGKCDATVLEIGARKLL